MKEMIPMIHTKKCILAFLILVMSIHMCSIAMAETCIVTSNKLLLRQEADSDSKALRTIPHGTKLEIIKKKGNWYKVSYGKFVGYVNGKYVVKGDTVQKDKGDLQKGDMGEKVKDAQLRLKELGYYKATCDGRFGNVMVTAVKTFQKKNGLTDDGIIGKTTMKKLNSNSAINAQGSTGVILDKSQTLKRGDSGKQVKALQLKLKELGYYVSFMDSDYGYRTEEAVSSFQYANGLTVNGIANPKTIKKILSSSAVTKAEADKKEKEKEKRTIKTEILDWFKKGKSTFSGRPVVQIKDVRTGLVFKAKVLYGTNHLDLEPFTKEDTAILLKINGGKDFSWQRRPMMVKHKGHVYAASIYSVPHGEQSIHNNNFDGQFCLHFSGSKTHGTNEVKEDHQACVAEALRATW